MKQKVINRSETVKGDSSAALWHKGRFWRIRFRHQGYTLTHLGPALPICNRYLAIDAHEGFSPLQKKNEVFAVDTKYSKNWVIFGDIFMNCKQFSDLQLTT